MSVPVLTPRAAREQRAFRQVLDAMARPGTIGAVDLHELGGRFAAGLSILESLLDHEVAFAVSPSDSATEEALLRLSGSHRSLIAAADYILAFDDGVETALTEARDGDPEYPDRGATVVVAVPSVSDRRSHGEPMTLKGPGIRDTVTVWIEGFPPTLQALFTQRNSQVPLGIDLVLVGSDGRFTCLPRYTRIQGGF